jgi:Ankyrin repeats (many copies)
LKRNDESLLLQSRGKDCIAIEVKYHRSCHKTYTSSLITKDGNGPSYLNCLFHNNMNLIAEEFVRMHGFYLDDQSAISALQNLKNAGERTGHGAIHVAVMHGNKELLVILMHQGATIDLKDSGGFTALYYACIAGNYDACRL